MLWVALLIVAVCVGIWGWNALLIISIILLIAFFSVWVADGLTHRRRAQKTHQTTKSLLFHMSAAWQEALTAHRQSKSGRSLDEATSAVSYQATKLRSGTGTPDAVLLPRELSFSYTDHYGQASQRTVRVMGITSNGEHQYLDGFCRNRRAVRTFRVDRIVGDLIDQETGEIISVIRLLSDSMARGTMTFESAPSKSNKNYQSACRWQTAVLFTGFTSKRREELEAMAMAMGWNVRSTVGNTLDVLVTGPKVGISKVVKAEALGIEVIDEFEFEARSDTDA